MMDAVRTKWMGLLIPIISILLAFLAGAVIMVLSGNNPITGYAALVSGIFGTPYDFGETLQRMTPLIFSGLAVAFAFRAGLLNIGVEGQLIVGWFTAVIAGIVVDLPTLIHIPFAIAAGALAGALWGAVPGFLKARFEVHEVIVTIMMNYIAMHVTNSLIRTYFLESGQRTAIVNESASLESTFLSELTNFSRLHWGFFIAAAACVVMWFILWKMKRGFELRSVGYNKNASMYAGMSVKGNIVLSMTISGAFAGAGGAMVGLGTYGYANILPAFTNIGFDGIAVALLGASTSIGIFLAAFLFGGLQQGANMMQATAGVSPELVEIVIALIIFFVASGYVIRWAIDRIASRKGEK
ncbi:ABC transporter permease [Alkalicoccus urumqiensis]|uniref:Branched-chain amino acid ABC transporter permease n=1 Tax=Alkalicoccus urumqiensis TaxID=1548213 RepID=A0A2P6MEJ5_ALKUR|nr:ABC transporter permease [Alkalicoccus urumqiensis]PRO64712.1 branched-chain amino acid ABC transporter permease [Alkalicoccus urumqiensis]